MSAVLSLVGDDYFDDTDIDDVRPEEPEGGFDALGVDRDCVVVFSHLQKAVIRLRPSDLKELNLRLRFGSTWFQQCSEFMSYDKKDPHSGRKGSGPAGVAKYVIAKCQDVGTYRAAMERRAGAWLDTDGGLVINGDDLWRNDGSLLAHGMHGGRVYPIAGSLGFGPDTAPATADELERVLSVFRSYNWKVPGAAELVLGWVGVCIVATAIRRRPHVLLIGPHGCGKSTLLEQVSLLLGPQCAAVTGSPTMMGLQQLVQHHPSRGVVVDEFESDGRNARRKGLFEAARASYSIQEGDSGVVRGSTSGEAKSYRLSSPFMAAGISPGSLEPSDVSRWVCLELGRLSERVGTPVATPTREEFQQLGPGLARLFVSRWPVLTASLPLFQQAICDVGGDTRQADTYGHLLACYWTFVSDEEVTAAAATQLLEQLQIEARFAKQATHDEQECLSALFTRVRTFDGVDGATVKLSVGEACKLVVDGRPGKQAVKAGLGRLGMRLRTVNGRWHLLVANSANHAELRRLFAGSKWSQGGWGPVLRRLPGGHESVQRLPPSMLSAKVTSFELPESMQPPGENDAV